eukprot:9988562-Karenia_brevis.AAC.1
MCTDSIHILKVATAVGIDLWPPADLRKLPSKALRQLACILQQVEAPRGDQACCTHPMLYRAALISMFENELAF